MNFDLPISGLLYFKLVVPEGELIGWTESRIYAVRLKASSPIEEKLRSEVESLKKQVEAHVAKIGELQSVLKERESELNELKAKYEKAVKELEDLRDSSGVYIYSYSEVGREVEKYRMYSYALGLLGLIEAVAIVYLLVLRKR